MISLERNKVEIVAQKFANVNQDFVGSTTTVCVGKKRETKIIIIIITSLVRKMKLRFKNLRQIFWATKWISQDGASVAKSKISFKAFAPLAAKTRKLIKPIWSSKTIDYWFAGFVATTTTTTDTTTTANANAISDKTNTFTMLVALGR